MKFSGNIKHENFKCSQYFKDIGHIDILTLYYVYNQPREITNDLIGYASNYNYLLAIAKVQVNMLINRRYKLTKDTEEEI